MRREGSDAHDRRGASIRNLLTFVSILHSSACFKASHFFFRFAYAIQQRRLRLLCSEDLLLEVYDRPLRMAASLMSFKALAISNMVLKALAL